MDNRLLAGKSQKVIDAITYIIANIEGATLDITKDLFKGDININISKSNGLSISFVHDRIILENSNNVYTHDNVNEMIKLFKWVMNSNPTKNTKNSLNIYIKDCDTNIYFNFIIVSSIYMLMSSPDNAVPDIGMLHIARKITSSATGINIESSVKTNHCDLLDIEFAISEFINYGDYIKTTKLECFELMDPLVANFINRWKSNYEKYISEIQYYINFKCRKYMFESKTYGSLIFTVNYYSCIVKLCYYTPMKRGYIPTVLYSTHISQIRTILLEIINNQAQLELTDADLDKFFVRRPSVGDNTKSAVFKPL